MSDTPRRDLAGRPQPLASVAPVVPSAAPSSSAQVGSASGRPSAATTGRPGPASPSASAAARASAAPYRVVAALDDGDGDQGLDGPAYGDLLRVLVEDDGRSARVTVQVAGALPDPAADRESLGIGVDFLPRATATESDYQLFADGNADGWFAYLHTPRGFVRYPGSFAVSRDRVVFVVPWSSLGGRTSGWFASFADWTRGGTTGALGGNKASRDAAPALGGRAWSR